ncbi:MAG: hypothetical protein V4603_07975 [Pseudomonadota bacterium]
MSLLSKFLNLFASHQRPPARPVVFDAEGFRLGVEDSPLAWDDVLKIVTYKIDLITVDEIFIDFIHANGVLIVGEENPGFHEFMIEVVHRFPTAIEWYEKVSQPAFAACTTVLYERRLMEC